MKLQSIKIKKYGFTLAELMAVVAIIAILASLSIGGYSRSMKRTVFTEGLQGAHTLAAAVDEYFYDHNGYPTNSDGTVNLGLVAASLKKSSVSNGKLVTPHFTYTLDVANGKIIGDLTGGTYGVVVFLDTGANRASSDQCTFKDDKSKSLCQSMGYKTNCSSSACSK